MGIFSICSLKICTLGRVAFQRELLADVACRRVLPAASAQAGKNRLRLRVGGSEEVAVQAGWPDMVYQENPILIVG